MFGRLRQRFDDMRSLTVLMRLADEFSRAMGDGPPGAEHLLLAALAHPDGSARRVFDRLDTTLDATRVAIERQYADALESVGLGGGVPAENGFRPEADVVCAASPGTFYTARESGRVLLERMAERQGRHRFESARVLEAVADEKRGVAARTLRSLDIDAAALRTAVADELEREPDIAEAER